MSELLWALIIFFIFSLIPYLLRLMVELVRTKICQDFHHQEKFHFKFIYF